MIYDPVEEEEYAKKIDEKYNKPMEFTEKQCDCISLENLERMDRDGVILPKKYKDRVELYRNAYGFEIVDQQEEFLESERIKRAYESKNLINSSSIGEIVKKISLEKELKSNDKNKSSLDMKKEEFKKMGALLKVNRNKENVPTNQDSSTFQEGKNKVPQINEETENRLKQTPKKVRDKNIKSKNDSDQSTQNNESDEIRDSVSIKMM